MRRREGDSGHEKDTAQHSSEANTQQLLTNGGAAGDNILSQLAVLGVQHLGQLGMQHEQAYLLVREHYQRSQGEQVGYRNGWLRAGHRQDRRGTGQVSGSPGKSYRSAVSAQDLGLHLGQLGGARATGGRDVRSGLSTRDVEDCFRDEAGNPMISRSAVSEITDQLREDLQAFCTRDLSGIRAPSKAGRSAA
jgi:hypothetical protein